MPQTSAILGRKVGMTRYFLDEVGKNVPVTVIQAGPCIVTQVKDVKTHKYSAIQLAFEDVSPKRATMQIIGHDAKAGTGPKRFHREVRLNDGDKVEFQVGQEIRVEAFADVMFVDVVGTSKGKGFQGVMKRHNFKGQLASHGVERKHRSPGSICGGGVNRGTGPKPKKGKRMAGQMGNVTVTSRNHDVIKVIPEQNLLLIKGTVPGPSDGMVLIRTSKRLGKSKQLKLAHAGK